MIQGGDRAATAWAVPATNSRTTKRRTFRSVRSRSRPHGPQKMQVMAKHAKGIVAMANAGRDTNGSQFFIMLETRDLPLDHSVFGEVGGRMVDKISVGDVGMTAVTVEDKK